AAVIPGLLIPQEGNPGIIGLLLSLSHLPQVLKVIHHGCCNTNVWRRRWLMMLLFVRSEMMSSMEMGGRRQLVSKEQSAIGLTQNNNSQANQSTPNQMRPTPIRPLSPLFFCGQQSDDEGQAWAANTPIGEPGKDQLM